MTLTTRPVEEADIPQLAELDARSWGRRGLPVLPEEHLTAWYEEQSPLFLVAEDDGVLCGYYFGRQIEFSMDSPESFTTPCTDGFEWDRHPHTPGAESCYGICTTAERGAGPALNAALHDVLESLKPRYFVGISRLSGFDHYLRNIDAGRDPLIDLALWYAHENAERLGMRRWPACTAKPSLLMPPVRRVDPVLAFHVRGTTFGLLGLLPEYLNDPASRNFGAVIVSEYPHRR